MEAPVGLQHASEATPRGVRRFQVISAIAIVVAGVPDVWVLCDLWNGSFNLLRTDGYIRLPDHIYDSSLGPSCMATSRCHPTALALRHSSTTGAHMPTSASFRRFFAFRPYYLPIHWMAALRHRHSWERGSSLPSSAHSFFGGFGLSSAAGLNWDGLRPHRMESCSSPFWRICALFLASVPNVYSKMSHGASLLHAAACSPS